MVTVFGGGCGLGAGDRDLANVAVDPFAGVVSGVCARAGGGVFGASRMMAGVDGALLVCED